MLAVRVRALLQERLAPSVEDVIALAPPVLRHRMALTFTARAEGMTLNQDHRASVRGNRRLMAAGATAASLTGQRQRAERLADRLPPLLVAAERVASTVAQGVHGRRRVGVGETFWQFRPYQPGDPTSRIDWRQSARTTQLFLRDQEWEAAESVWLWADSSASMAYRSAAALVDQGASAPCFCCWRWPRLLTRAGERIALLGERRRPTGGRVGMATLCEDLMAGAGRVPQPRAGPAAAALCAPGPGERLLHPARASCRARLRNFVAMGVRGHLLQVLDPAEPELPFAGRVRFEGMERDGSALIANVDGIRRRYQGRLEAHREGLRDLVRSLGWTFASHLCDRPPEPALLALYSALSTKGQG